MRGRRIQATSHTGGHVLGCLDRSRVVLVRQAEEGQERLTVREEPLELAEVDLVERLLDLINRLTKVVGQVLILGLGGLHLDALLDERRANLVQCGDNPMRA